MAASKEGAKAGAEVREKTVGRFRLVPHSRKFQKIIVVSTLFTFFLLNSLTANFAPASPFLGRSRFSVIPEEPHGSPLQGTPATEKQPSTLEWDFDDDKRVVSVTFSYLFIDKVHMPKKKKKNQINYSTM